MMQVCFSKLLDIIVPSSYGPTFFFLVSVSDVRLLSNDHFKHATGMHTLP